ncbi:cache domain-containing sensor histidine kinase [Cohnella thailandensis]|nr:sensor histidine kinase [Cohnella thailandensis]MBP1973845.1 two-component system sensor histidine kinase YesM [Cohnella thailandensis]
MKRRMPRLPSRLAIPASRMETKLAIVFLFLIILPIGLISYISSIRYSDTIEKNTVTYATQLTDRMMSKLDDYMLDMKKISILPSYLAELKDGLKMSNNLYDGKMNRNEDLTDLSPEEQTRTIEIQRKIGSNVNLLNNIKSGTNSFYMFDRYGHVYYETKNQRIRADLSTVYAEWSEKAYAAHGTPVLLSTQEVANSPNAKRYVFTVVRELIDPASYARLGVIALDANISVIENIVKDLDTATKGQTMIIDNDGKVIYDSEKKYLTQNWTRNDLMELTNNSHGSFHSDMDGEPSLTIYKQSSETGWRVLMTIPQEQLMEDATLTRNFTIISASVIMIFALLISLVLVFALTRPMRSLVKLMKEVQTGNMDVVFPVVRRDEMGLVGSAFNRMIDRVKTLISDIVVMEKRKKEAELQSLQTQINPHFIYNTLESIRMTAVLNDDNEVGEMTRLLGKLLRYSIHAGTETVPLEQEWDHLRMYVQLLNYRYGNRFKLELPEDSEIRMNVMKLLFQPIVENAVYHGMDEDKTGMTIKIEHQLEGTDHLFRVMDDGVGMDEDKLSQLRAGLREELAEWDGHGIGLRNVNERLKLRYGEPYGIGIESEPGVGTTVIVRIPQAHMKEE